MITFTTPEKVGIDSKYVQRFMTEITRQHINLHDVILMRGDQIFFEKYWAPFTADFPHRMYSVTKSFVSIAIGFLQQEGKLSLDDPIIRYFPDKLPQEADPLLARQTIRDMLMMCTCYVTGNWFRPEVTDRLKYYFDRPAEKVPGTLFTYDSNGSYVLGCLVERLSGMRLLDYLKEKVLDRLGYFDNAHILSTMDGTPWADSALICRPRALAAFARFVMNGGAWEGEQLLDREYVQTAVSRQTDNVQRGNHNYNAWGYGYQFWMDEQGAYSFNGMGAQFVICDPKHDLILVCNGDDQLSSETDSPRIFRAFFDHIAAHADNVPQEEELFDLDAPLALSVARGKRISSLLETINGKTYQCLNSPLGKNIGWRWFRLDFTEDGGVLSYENEQGEKQFAFGIKENRYGTFPQAGYSDEYGNRHEVTDFRYKMAASAGWVDENKLQIRVQVIDRYFGLLILTFGFKDDLASVCMEKSAEDFFDEYQGWLIARRRKG